MPTDLVHEIRTASNSQCSHSHYPSQSILLEFSVGSSNWKSKWPAVLFLSCKLISPAQILDRHSVVSSHHLLPHMV